MNIYVGNLPYEVDDAQLHELFSQFGQVENTSVIMDHETGRSRGFGFVIMPDAREAQQAIDALHEKDFIGRTLKVNEAKPRGDRFRPQSGGTGHRGPAANRFGVR